MTPTTIKDAVAPTTAAGPPTPTTSRWRYSEGTTRDRRLDFLRGCALAAMSINHFGLSQSYLHELSGRSSFLVSAAEAFLVISGFTLGVISRSRTPEQVTQRLAKRTWTVYLATIGISFGLGIVALTTSFDLWGDLDIDSPAGIPAWVGQVLTMQTAFNGADILIAYVLYLTAGIAALRLMTSGRSRVVLAATVGGYVLSQYAGSENVSLGFASFRVLLPNAPLFFGGLLIGFHRDLLNAQWQRFRYHRLGNAATIAAAVALAWMHSNAWEGWTWLGEVVIGPDLEGSLGLRETSMPVMALAVVALYLRVAWLLVDMAWVPLKKVTGWFMLPLGEASLFTFTMHLVAIPLIVNLPWWPGQDIGRLAATFWVAIYLAVIFNAVAMRKTALAWLHAGGATRERVRSHGPLSIVAALLVVVLALAGNPTGPMFDEASASDDATGQPDFAEEVGQIVDALVAGELTEAQVLDLLPADVDPATRAEIATLLEDDPYAAETLLFDALWNPSTE